MACIPQAWASAACFALLGALLGVSFNSHMRQIRLTRPVLPISSNRFEIHNLQFAGGAVDLLFRRHTRDVALNVLRKDGNVEVLLVG